MATVFLLNAAGLYLFPMVGHALHLSQYQFGVWAGVAIHDVSSVVGAALTYWQQALETATAIKLSRTLWIVPLVFGISLAARRRRGARNPGDGRCPKNPEPGESRRRKMELPWFILLFLLASLARSCFPAIARWAAPISAVARGGLTIALCLIGASLSLSNLRSVGWKAPIQGTVLWVFISLLSLAVVLHQR